MKENTEIQEIVIHDNYGQCLSDSVGSEKKRPGSEPSGYVEIYEVSEDGKKKLVGKTNLVLYRGREWLASRIFNTINPNIVPLPDEFICWFGVGEGGCLSGDSINPTSPINSNEDLMSEVSFNDNDPLCGDYRNNLYFKHPFDSIEFEEDIENESRFLVIKVTTTVGINDANGFNLSECGLFTAASNEGGYSGNFNIYARVTFPSIVKNPARQLVFIWYCYV